MNVWKWFIYSHIFAIQIENELGELQADEITWAIFGLHVG